MKKIFSIAFVFSLCASIFGAVLTNNIDYLTVRSNATFRGNVDFSGATINGSGMASVDVKVLGAKGDGVTDDTAVFKRALTNAGTIYVPRGRYVINTNLFMTNNTWLVGTGPGAILIMGSFTNWLLDATGRTNVVVDNIVFDGTNNVLPSSLGTRNGLKMDLGTNGFSYVRDCKFGGFSGIGLSAVKPGGVLGGQNWTGGFVDHCQAKLCGYGFYEPEISGASDEYSEWSQCEAVSCWKGFYKVAGNVVNIGHRITTCTFGIELDGSGSNPQHGSWTGTTFNHNTIPIYGHGIISGEQFSGGYCIASGPVILNQCTGFEFSGMAMDGRFIITNSAVGAVNFITGCRFQGDWQTVKAQQTNDSSAVYFGNICWNNGGVTNSSDGTFGNYPYPIKPLTYSLGDAQLSGGTFSTANTPTPWFDIGSISWTASGGGGFAAVFPAKDITPVTNSIISVTVLNTNTATVTVTNVGIYQYYFQTAGRAGLNPVIYGTLQFPQGYTTFTLTNSITNSVLKRAVGAFFGQGNVNQNLYMTRFQEQPIQ